MLGVSEKQFFCFAFLSFFRNFGFAEDTMHSEMKRKVNFPFAFLSFFCTFVAYYDKKRRRNKQ